MPSAAVALVLAAVVLHALWNVRLHGADDRAAAMAMSGIVSGIVLLPFLLLAPPNGLWGLVRNPRFDVARLRASIKPGIAIAIGSVGAYALVLFAFRLAPVSRVATLREVSVVLAVLLVRERPGVLGWAAIAAVAAGAALAAA